jgi:hypothetical protein
MKGTVLAQGRARLSDSASRLVDTPTAVIAAVAVSACVAAICGYVVLSKAWPHVQRPDITAERAVAQAPTRPVPRPGRCSSATA